MVDQLSLRIVVVRPLAGVTMQLQRGKTALQPPAFVRPGMLGFETVVRLGPIRPGRPPNFLGEFAHGTPADRFIYVNSGVHAGQPDSCWDRRAKVPLGGISWELIEKYEATPGAMLEARIEGTMKKGGPVCASVSLLDGGWRVIRAEASA